MPTLVTTSGAANANGYATVAEISAYLAGRGDILTAWDATADQEAIAIQATRVLESMTFPYIYFDKDKDYFVTRPTWTGAAVDGVQALSWPRTGMLNRNGYEIGPTIIPQELKDAVSELAGQLALGERLVDNDAAVQGLTSIKAGSVALSFKDSAMTSKVLPDFVEFLLIPSWLSDEVVENRIEGIFEVL